MNQLRSLILTISLLHLGRSLLGQCEVTSTNGYTVNFFLKQQNVILTPAGPSCNYNVVLDYDIVYSGPNQSNLWSINGSTDCIPDPDLGFNMPTSGKGSTATYTSTFNGDCSDLKLDCDVKLTVLGPGISTQTLAGCTHITYPLNLPVEFLDFKSEMIGGGILLKWSTASESNNQGFEVESSLDGKEWERIGWVDGAGTSNTVQSYQFFVAPPKDVKSLYFRLRQLDFDGRHAYSSVISTQLASSTEDGLLISPNPTGGIVHIQAEGYNRIRVYNLMGQNVLSLPFSNTLDLSSLGSGIFMLVLSNQQGQLSHRIVVE